MTAEQGFLATGTLARTTATTASNASLSASQQVGSQIIANYARYALVSGGSGFLIGANSDLQPDDANISVNPLAAPFQVGNLLGGMATADPAYFFGPVSTSEPRDKPD